MLTSLFNRENEPEFNSATLICHSNQNSMLFANFKRYVGLSRRKHFSLDRGDQIQSRVFYCCIIFFLINFAFFRQLLHKPLPGVQVVFAHRLNLVPALCNQFGFKTIRARSFGINPE